MCGDQQDSYTYIPQITVMHFSESAHFHLVLTIRLLVTLQFSDLKCVLFYLTIPAKKIIGCRYFAKCTSLNLTLGALGTSGLSKGAVNGKTLLNVPTVSI